jgi:hypothetical protein
VVVIPVITHQHDIGSLVSIVKRHHISGLLVEGLWVVRRIAQINPLLLLLSRPTISKREREGGYVGVMLCYFITINKYTIQWRSMVMLYIYRVEMMHHFFSYITTHQHVSVMYDDVYDFIYMYLVFQRAVFGASVSLLPTWSHAMSSQQNQRIGLPPLLLNDDVYTCMRICNYFFYLIVRLLLINN